MAKDAVVRIDGSLLREVEEFIKSDEGRFLYANRKQFIDRAVLEFLKKHWKKRDGKHRRYFKKI
ncbi:hypothetical protein D6829_00200 [Candidatus Pacearchaeota archaeon]|nr:MAG: hypothetical protein D6829_00200 [Candidatus Pacearchaeota archaeon]